MQRPSRLLSAEPAPLRLARRAWRLLHRDAPACLAMAERALQRAQAAQDLQAEAWARLVRAFHQLYFAQPVQALDELEVARQAFARVDDRAGHLLACAGTGRGLWRSGQVAQALDLLLPLRDEGLLVLQHEQRGVLLNAIAGCYSALGRHEEAFAYMYEALRGAGPAFGHGFDVALYCNLAHELLLLGDCDEALAHVDRGLQRCQGLRNLRLQSVLRINRVIGLTELGRANETLDDIAAVLAMPPDASGRGVAALHHETLALAALRAGRTALGAELLQRAQAGSAPSLPDERVELVVAGALLAAQQGDPAQGLVLLQSVAGLVSVDGAAAEAPDRTSPASYRVRCLHAQVASELHEALGDSVAALASMRQWQTLHALRARAASRARYQAAALQTELLRLQHQLEENESKRRVVERAHAELALANEQLSKHIAEVQSLQSALREQATQDALTGLFNRRHLNETMPGLLAMAQRELHPLAVVLIDLDHFKRVNDTFGHAAGDHLLAAFGALLRHDLRRSDVAFRFGGEEFCLLLPHTTAAGAAAKVQALRQRWSGQAFEIDGAVLGGLGFSAGVCDTRQGHATVDHLLRAADDALLRAKRSGRNQVLCAEPLLAD